MAAALGKLKQWLARKRTSRPSSVSLGPPPALLERYLQYKRLLAANSSILTTVADIQVKMDEGFLFDMNYVREACDRLGQEVEAMVGALNGMAGGRYAALDAARRQVNHLVAEELIGAKLQPAPLALPLAEVREGSLLRRQGREIGRPHPAGAHGARGLWGERLCPEALF